MNHTLCIIDDAIPASDFIEFIDDTKKLDTFALKFMLAEEAAWQEPPLRELVSAVTNGSQDWEVCAFTTPSFYFSHHEDQLFSPDIIFFDWEYGGETGSSEEYLMKILETTYAVVNIYTGADIENQVTELIGSKNFKPYEDRLRVVKKGEENSVEKLIEFTEERLNSNFSFKYGQELKNHAIAAIDSIMIEVAKLSMGEFVANFGYKNGNNYEISDQSLTAILSEKFKHELIAKKFSASDEKHNVNKVDPDEELSKQIWNYRLYHSPVDDIVRKGDIIVDHTRDWSKLYLVLSSDCHMNMFWKKNFGYLALAPLYRLDKSQKDVYEKFRGLKRGGPEKINITSLTNSSIEGITILPGIRGPDGNLYDYMLNCKEVFTVNEEIPGDLKPQEPVHTLKLKYSYVKKFDGAGRIRLSSPFLSPLVQYAVSHITGYGCPDFPKHLIDNLDISFNESRKKSE